MNAQRLPSECPDAGMLERYVTVRATSAERSVVEEHLGRCERCARQIAEMRANEDALRTLIPTVSASDAESATTVNTIEQAQKLVGEKFSIIRKVGAGGMGQVYQAVDSTLERFVAVKFLGGSRGEGTDAERWQEARLASKMNHPNIAQVYETGEALEKRFIVMEWVDGVELTEAWRGMSLEQRLNSYLGALDAVASAHRNGIVHRDIKPSNILVTAAGRTKVLDFGIACEWEVRNGVEKGVFRGTPGYSAPEQVTVPVNVSPATDVFALGVLLYQLLTDELPFAQRDMKELFEAIRNEHPELPTAIRDRTPIPLQNICLKALEKDPLRRYADAQGLRDDVTRFLRGEKVWSRPSFLVDKIQQDVFFHRQRLEVWRQNELITQKEYDKLEGIYEGLIAPADPSIMEARELSLSQVCLYLGGWLAVLGSFVLFYKQWDQIPLYWRPTPAVLATIAMAFGGIMMWRNKESRLAVGILATANLLLPIAMLLMLGQWRVLSAIHYPWGTETLFNVAGNPDARLAVGNVQLYLVTGCWLACSLAFLRLTRSSIFVIFGIVAFLAWLTVCYLVAGMEKWEPDVIAGRYLYPGAGLFIFGTLLDRRGLAQYAWAPAIVGVGLIVLSLSAIAISPATLLGWVLSEHKLKATEEQRYLSFICNGVVYLCLAGVCLRLGTRLQRWLANALNWLGPIHILYVLRVLDSSIGGDHRQIYRFLLPIASLAFVLGSVVRQMKSFFFSGLAGVAVAVHKITTEHFEKYFAWPVSLIITGIAWMAVSWLVPRWKARSAVKKR